MCGRRRSTINAIAGRSPIGTSGFGAPGRERREASAEPRRQDKGGRQERDESGGDPGMERRESGRQGRAELSQRLIPRARSPAPRSCTSEGRMRLWSHLAWVAVIGTIGAAAAVACSNDAVGVQACRQIETVRCEAAPACPSSFDLSLPVLPAIRRRGLRSVLQRRVPPRHRDDGRAEQRAGQPVRDLPPRGGQTGAPPRARTRACTATSYEYPLDDKRVRLRDGGRRDPCRRGRGDDRGRGRRRERRKLIGLTRPI